MNTKHTKSPCCGAASIHFGQRRRQCTSCRKTWRIRKKRRGRKQIRISLGLATTLLTARSTTIQGAKHTTLTKRQYQYRLGKSLTHFRSDVLLEHVPQQSKLILLIDGLWVTCGGKRFVVYLLSVRPIHSTTSYLLPPTIFAGAETAPKWEQVIEGIPTHIRGRIVGLVCDGLSGMEGRGQRRGWVVQRCQFHYLKTIQRFRGLKNRFVKEKLLREEIYTTIRHALLTLDESAAEKLRMRIEHLSDDSRCPKWVGVHCRELLRHWASFRAFSTHIEINLPTTNNCMESLCGVIRNRLYLARGFKTPSSLMRWVTGVICVQRKIKCNGFRQPN